MIFFTRFLSDCRIAFVVTLLLCTFLNRVATGQVQQPTYWTGAVSSTWGTAGNWSPAVVPGAETDVVIGTNFTGSNHPEIDERAVVNVKSITLTNASGKSPKLLVTNNFNVVIGGNLTIGAGTTLENNGADVVIQGDFINSGSLVETVFLKNNGRKGRFYPSFEMSGTGKIGGDAPMVLSHLRVSGTVTLEQHLTIQTMNISVTGQNLPPTSDLTISGTFNPGTRRVTFNGKGITASDATNSLVVEGGGTLMVMATTYSDNYSMEPTSMIETSIVNYAAAAGTTQTILPRWYGVLKISGGGTKRLEAAGARVTDLSASSQLIVETAGTMLDLQGFTLNRQGSSSPVAGGTFTLSNATFLRIGGTGAFPSGYSTVNLGPTSTVEYYGTAQTVSTQTYGNLILSGSGTKTMPAALFTVAGDFSSTGTVNFTAGNNFTVLGNVNIGAGTTFAGSTRTITVGGNWTNNGTFTPGTSTVVMNGAGMRILRASGSVPFHHLSITTGQITAGVNTEVFGNVATTGAGKFTSTANLTMSGIGSISGEGITLNNLTGNGTTTTTAVLAVNGNLTVNSTRSFTASAGVINMQGQNTAIVNNGTLQLYSLRTLGTTTTGSSFAVLNNLSGTGTLTATNGTITFTGASTFGGTHLLNNVTVAANQTLTLNANSNLGIANVLSTASGATLDVTANAPNTVTFNKAGAQDVPGRQYYHLVVANSGVKTATAGVTVLGDFRINTGFAAGAHTHSVAGNFYNNAASNFDAGTGTIKFNGSGNSLVEGLSTVFNVLEVNKTVGSSYLQLNHSIQTKDLMVGTTTQAAGEVRTGNNTLTVTGDRTGMGWVYGTIRRERVFAANQAFEFAGPYNTISLQNTTGITAITVTNTSGVVASFSNGSAINRRYAVSITGGSNFAGTMRLQYNELELNGNSEENMQLFKAATAAGPWEGAGASDRSAVENWVENNTLSDIRGNWTLSESAGIYTWVGATSTDWATASNWSSSTGTATQPPSAGDIVQFGGNTVINQPTLTGTTTVKAIQFLDNGAPITLTLGSGAALTVNGNITANGAGASSRLNNAIVVSNAGATLHIGGSLELTGGLNNNISLQVNTGTVSVAGDITQDNAGGIALSAGTLKIGGDYNGAGFTAGVGSTVIYNGAGSQVIAPVSYYNLDVSKESGVATLTTEDALTINGNLSMTGSGELALRASNLTVSGNVSQTLGTIDAGNSLLKVGGNWTRAAGTFTPSTSTVEFTGSTAAAIGDPAESTTHYTFNKLKVSKGASTVFAVNKDIRINADLEIASGTVNLGLKTVSRTAPGGSLVMGSAGTLLLENSNFPANFMAVQLNASSNVVYQGTMEQLVAAVTYGNLTFDNGNATPKRLQAATTVYGTLAITNDATLQGDGETLNLKGNFSLADGGQFIAGDTYSEGTLVLSPVVPETKNTRYLIGAITVHNLLLEPYTDYVLSNQSTSNGLTIKGDFNNNQGSINGTTLRATFEGDFINTGELKSSGVAAFTGTRQQTIQLHAPITPAGINPLNNQPAPPAVEFNGNVPPVLNSTEAPRFGSVVINNTGGVTASVNWLVGGVLYVKPGAKFHGGSYTHTFATGIDNDGLITSSGTMYLNPIDQGIISMIKTAPYYPYKLAMTPAAFQSTGTLRIGGTEMLALLGFVPGVLNNVLIDNTNPAGVKGTSISDALGLSLHGSWDIKGNLTVAQGTTFHTGTASQYMLPTSETTSIPMASGYYTIGGNLTNNGTINGAGSDFILTNAAGRANQVPSPALVNGTGITTLRNLTIEADAGVELDKTVSINQDLTYKGADLNSSGGMLRFVGTGNSLIKVPMASNAVSISNMVVEKAANANLTLEADVHDVNKLQVLSGTLNLAAHEVLKPVVLAGDLSESVLEVADGAFLRLGKTGSTSQLQLDKYTFAENSTVEYYAGSAVADSQVVLSEQYGHLVIKSPGTKTFASGTAKIAGNFTVTAGPAVVAPATIEYNGSAAQTVAAINYNHLVFSTAGTKTLAAGTTGVANAFTNPGSAAVNTISNSSTVDYNGEEQSVLPINYHNLRLSNSGVKTFSGRTGVAAAFTTAGSATADLTTNATTVDFNGTGAQNIPALDYSKLLLSAGGTKQLTGNARVAEELRLTNGKINTGSNKFKLGNMASIIETEGNFVTGFVETQRTMTTALEAFGGLGITVTPAVSPGEVTVLRETGRAVASSTGNTSILRNYSFTTSGTNRSLDATVSFGYLRHELGTFDENTLQFYTSADGVIWKLHGSSYADPVNTRVGANGVNRLSRFTLGSSASPLPVELKYLLAEKLGQNAVITWETANEQNNKGFDIEVSLDGVSYRKLGFVNKGTATLRAGTKYTYTDTEYGKNGVRYYRLKQIDLNDEYAYYGPRAVIFEASQAVAATAYPNPFQAKLQISFSAEKTGAAKAILYNAAGKVICQEMITAESGYNNKQLNTDLQHLSSGLYMLVLELDGKTQNIKLIRE